VPSHGGGEVGLTGAQVVVGDVSGEVDVAVAVWALYIYSIFCNCDADAGGKFLKVGALDLGRLRWR
jgi:hypothetical protein